MSILSKLILLLLVKYQNVNFKLAAPFFTMLFCCFTITLHKQEILYWVFIYCFPYTPQFRVGCKSEEWQKLILQLYQNSKVYDCFFSCKKKKFLIASSHTKKIFDYLFMLHNAIKTRNGVLRVCAYLDSA